MKSVILIVIFVGFLAINVGSTNVLQEMVDEVPQDKQESPSSFADELASIEQDLITAENTTTTEDESVRTKRTARIINGVFCTFFRSSASCQNRMSTTTESSDDFWLNYLNNNGTEVTTTTRRPGFFAWKRERLARFFPRLFGSRSGDGNNGGGFFSQLIQAPIRIFRRLNLGRLVGGGNGGYSNDADF